MHKTKREIYLIYGFIFLLFLLFLFIPLIEMGRQSFLVKGHFSFDNYSGILHNTQFYQALSNSVTIAGVSGLVSVLLAFFLAYTINFSTLNTHLKKIVRLLTVLPMLLPTITYGFAIIYAYGKQGLVTKLLGMQLFNIYGFKGLLIGYVIYTLPVSFLLLDNTMKYMDKRLLIVSTIMGDNAFTRFKKNILVPLIVTLCSGFIQTFFLSFTDFGIPAAVGGEYPVIASLLYNEMLGTVSNVSRGSVIAIFMFLPAIASIVLLKYIEKFNVRYQKSTKIELPKSRIRDSALGVISGCIVLNIFVLFLTVIIVPFVRNWPYDLNFSMEHLQTSLFERKWFRTTEKSSGR